MQRMGVAEEVHLEEPYLVVEEVVLMAVSRVTFLHASLHSV